jgi:hypothetical protein
MNWNFQRSKDRLAAEWARINEAGLNIQRLTREMDLSNLSPSDARIVHGAHLYCHIANFSEVIDSPLMRRDDFKRLHRLLHILRIEQRQSLQQVFDGEKFKYRVQSFTGFCIDHRVMIRHLRGNPFLQPCLQTDHDGRSSERLS